MMVSVIIPSYNSERTIGHCLHSLQNQTYTGSFEIILVDSSIDHTPVIVGRDFPSIHYFHFDQKTDPGTARNHGIRHAAGELILFIDSDCVADKNWMEKLVNLHKALPEVAAIGGAVVNGNSPDDTVGWASYFSEFREFIPENPEAYVMHIPTLNISYKKWVFEKYGFFDPHYYPQEDLLFNYALIKKNEKILFNPAIQVWHTHRSKVNDFFRHQQNIGKITAQVLKIIPLSGYQIARNKFLFFIVGFLLPVVKFLRTLAILLRRRPSVIFKHLCSVFFLKMGLFYWFAGFTQGVFSTNTAVRK